MPLPLLLALALQTAPEPPSAPAVTPAVPAAADTSDIPHGAPTDDYGFVAWCRGALSGHMDLYPAVKPELRKIESEKAAKEDARYTTDAQRQAAAKRRAKEAAEDSKLDQEQLAAGKTYLKLYADALASAEAASAANLRKRGEEAQDSGFRIWSAARVAEPRTKMWSWIMWELPARCETAAKRLKERSSLLAGVLKPQPEAAETVAATAPSAVAADAPAGDVAATAPPSDPSGLRLRSFSARQPALDPNAAPPTTDAPADTPVATSPNADAPTPTAPAEPAPADAPKA